MLVYDSHFSGARWYVCSYPFHALQTILTACNIPNISKILLICRQDTRDSWMTREAMTQISSMWLKKVSAHQPLMSGPFLSFLRGKQVLADIPTRMS